MNVSTASARSNLSPTSVSRRLQLAATSLPGSSINFESCLQQVRQGTSLYQKYYEALAAMQDTDPVPARILLREVIKESEDPQLSASAHFFLARKLPQSDPEVRSLYEAVIRDLATARIQRVSASYSLALLYLNGEGGEQSDRKARPLFEAIANSTSPPEYEIVASFWLGVFHNEGRGGGPVSKQKAVPFFQKVAESKLACDEHKAIACYWLASGHTNGEGGLPVDYKKAATLYNQVLTYRGLKTELIAQTRFWLGRFHQKGWGNLEQSDRKARDLFTQANLGLKNGQLYALNQYYLGVFLISGRGGPQNYNKGASLLFPLLQDQTLPSSISVSVRFWLANAIELAESFEKNLEETLGGQGWHKLSPTKLYKEVIDTPHASSEEKVAARCAYAHRDDVPLEESKRVLIEVIQDPSANAEKKAQARTMLALWVPPEEGKVLLLQVVDDPEARWTDQMLACAWLGRYFGRQNQPNQARAFFKRVVDDNRAFIHHRLRFLQEEIEFELERLNNKNRCLIL